MCSPEEMMTVKAVEWECVCRTTNAFYLSLALNIDDGIHVISAAVRAVLEP